MELKFICMQLAYASQSMWRTPFHHERYYIFDKQALYSLSDYII